MPHISLHFNSPHFLKIFNIKPLLFSICSLVLKKQITGKKQVNDIKIEFLSLITIKIDEDLIELEKLFTLCTKMSHIKGLMN